MFAPTSAMVRMAPAELAVTTVPANPVALMAMIGNAALTAQLFPLMLMDLAGVYVWAALPAALMRPTASMTRVASPRREDW